MKLQQIAMGVIFSTLALTSINTFATQQLPDNTMKMSQILQKMQQDGFTVIKEIKFDGKNYLAKAINSDGSDIKLEISPTGEIMNPKEIDHNIPMLDAVQKVENAGYKSITEIDASKKKYEIKAFDKNNKEVKLKVDAKSGQIKE